MKSVDNTFRMPPSSLILALDTTTEHGSLALARQGEVLEEVELHSREGFSGLIFSEIARLLERHGVKLSEIGAYAPAAGPGSFTGVRIGMTAAKGLAEAHGRPVVPISNLMAVAALARSQPPAPDPRPLAPVLDARRGQIAGAVYSPELKRLLEPMVATPEEFAQAAAKCGAESEGVIYCGPEASRFAPPGASFVVTPRALAGTIARLAAAELAAGRGLAADAADADYVRRPDIRLKH